MNKGRWINSSALWYLSASEKFAEALSFYNSVVGEPQLLVFTSKLRIGVCLKGVLNNGSTNFIPDINRIK